MSSVAFAAQDAQEYCRSLIMSEFSSGAFKPFGSPGQFVLHQHKFGVRASEAEEDNYQDVKWRVQDNLQMEGVTSVDHANFLSRPDSALTLSSSPAPCATFDHFNQHVVVDEIFSRDATSFEPSHNLYYPSSGAHVQLDELYGGYHGGPPAGRWQAPPDPNQSCDNDVLVVVPVNSQETAKPLDYHDHLASSNINCNLNSAGSFNFPKFSSPPSRLSTSAAAAPPLGSTISPPVENSLGLSFIATATATAVPFRNSPRPPICESKRFQGRGRGKGDSRVGVSRTNDQHMTLGLGSQSMAVSNYHQALKVVRSPSDYTLGKRHLYSPRVTPDHLEHVQRERQRRDDMSAKIATLETLLPPASKRDRVSIVHDGIHYVKALLQKVKDLQDQLNEAKLKAEAWVQDKKRSSLGGSSSNLEFPSSSRNVNATRPSARFGQRTFRAGTSTQSGRAEFEGNASGSGRSGPLLGLTPKSEPLQNRGPISVELHVQVDRPGEEVQVIKCECRYSYLSSVMRTLDQLQLSVHQCSVTKLHDYVICVIVIKPTSICSTAHAVSSAQIATLLQLAAAES